MSHWSGWEGIAVNRKQGLTPRSFPLFLSFLQRSLEPTWRKTMAENNRPIHQVRIGRIKAAVFANGDNAPRKVQFTALYKDGDAWRGSAEFCSGGPAAADEGSGPGSLVPVRAERPTKRFFRGLLRFLEANLHHRPPANRSRLHPVSQESTIIVVLRSHDLHVDLTRAVP